MGDGDVGDNTEAGDRRVGGCGDRGEVRDTCGGSDDVGAGVEGLTVSVILIQGSEPA